MSIKQETQKQAIVSKDHGNEFKNNLMTETLKAFAIRRSLSVKGCPYDTIMRSQK